MTDLWAPSGRAGKARVALDVIGSVLFGLVSVAAASSGSSALAMPAAAALIVALVVRHWWPRVAVGLAALSGLLQIVVPEAFAIFADLAFAPIFYLLGGHREARVRRFGLIAAGVAVLACGVRSPIAASPHPDDWGQRVALGFGFATTAAVVALGGWVAGYIRHQSRQTVEARMEARVAEAEQARLQDQVHQEQERNRIATEMHDVVAHSWAVVAAQADGARYALRTSPETAENALEVIGDTARSAITDLRRILRDLRFQEPSEGSYGPEQHAAVLDRFRASGMNLQYTESGERPASDLMALTVHKVLLEALTNALKHGVPGALVGADVRWRDGARLTVTNRIADAPGTGTGHGLLGMHERVHSAGGTLSARAEGDRWVVRAHIPDHDVTQEIP